jgi:hypothetical protein
MQKRERSASFLIPFFTRPHHLGDEVGAGLLRPRRDFAFFFRFFKTGYFAKHWKSTTMQASVKNAVSVRIVAAIMLLSLVENSEAFYTPTLNLLSSGHRDVEGQCGRLNQLHRAEFSTPTRRAGPILCLIMDGKNFEESKLEPKSWEERLSDIVNRFTALETEVSEQNLVISKQTVTISELRATLSEQAATISRHETTISEQAATISRHETTISEHAATISRHETTISEHAATISRHETTISEQAATISRHETTISRHETTISELHATDSKLSGQVLMLCKLQAVVVSIQIMPIFLGSSQDYPNPPKHAKKADQAGPQLRNMLKTVMGIPDRDHNWTIDLIDALWLYRNNVAHPAIESNQTIDELIQVLKENHGALDEREKLALQIMEACDGIGKAPQPPRYIPISKKKAAPVTPSPLVKPKAKQQRSRNGSKGLQVNQATTRPVKLDQSRPDLARQQGPAPSA